jgi:Type IIA topoisomerase (DNA gyrase/topo II, topoisomerase IV), A subunit
VHAKTHTDILFFSSLGRIYRSRGHQIYSGTRDSKGHPIQNLLNLEKDEKIVALIAVDEYGEDQYLFFTTSKGIVKRTCIQEFARINSNGKIAIGLNDDDQLLSVKKTDGTAFVGLAASNGKLAKFHENDVRVMGRSAHGVRGMNVGTKDAVIDVVTSLEGDSILSLSEKGIGKISSFESYRLTKRGASGVFTMKITEKTGNIVGVRAVNKDNDLMVITNQGTIIRTSLENFREAGRNTSGVIIMRPREKEIISSLALVPHADEESESGEEAASE